MIDFIKRNKTFLAVVIITLILLVGGVYLFSGGSSVNPKTVSASILIPDGTQVTGGILNGIYQPANPNAKVNLVEFGDYQCPACGAYSVLVKQALTEFNGKINVAFRDMAFIGPESLKSAEATYCAGDQGKYWEFHDYLYTHQNGENKGNFSDENLKTIAKSFNLNMQTFNQCLDSSKYKGKVEGSTTSGNGLGINSTPTFFINGIKIETLPGAYDQFKSLIQDALNNAPAPSGSPAASYHVHFDLKTYINGSPVNFSLAKYQESSTNQLDENIHFHDGNGNIVHVHKTGIPLSQLFNSIKIAFPNDSAKSNLKIYVNGHLNSQGLAYVPQDLDQILVSFGPVNDTSIVKQVSSVTNNACIYSLKCPDRGTPPPEACSGGLGTGCTD